MKIHVKWMLTCPISSVPGILQTGALQAALNERAKTRQNSILLTWVGNEELNKWTTKNWGVDSPRRNSRINFETSETFLISFVYITVVFLLSNSVPILLWFNIRSDCLKKCCEVLSILPQALFCRRGRVEDGSVNRVLSLAVSAFPPVNWGKGPSSSSLFRVFQGQNGRERMERNRISLIPINRSCFARNLSDFLSLGADA